MEIIRELSRLQDEHGYLREQDLRALSERKKIPLYRLQGVMSFYPHFRTTPPPRAEVTLCRDLSCHMAGGAACIARAKAELGKLEGVEVHEVSCIGRCDAAPAATVNGIPVSAADTAKLAAYARNPGTLPPDEPGAPDRWKVDPYATPDQQYGALRDALATADHKAAGDRIIGEIKTAGLRGMGGAGFPTGTKWDLVRKETAVPKYVVCNADESEPGTFKDREILRSVPHLVIEGMVLGGLTVGAHQGIVYLRHEYAREGKALKRAIDDAYARGFLGKNILGSGFAFELEIFLSPGGYILGEETALLEALEDKRGEPRNKPPFPGVQGLWGKPTLINNVETLAMAAAIARRGGEWWKACGKAPYAGLKFLSVSGDVARPGVYEVPMGTTVRELLEIAGGPRDGKEISAFMPGGASSAFLPASKIDTALDFKAVQDAGSMLGSGAVVYVAAGTDLVDLGTNVVKFFRNESCGKCVPCRTGSEKAVEILEAGMAGKATPADLDRIPALHETLSLTSICGLGQVALVPILSVIQNFPADFNGRMNRKR